MSTLDLARIQFAATSIYHFLFVPITIGLAFLVALLQTAWHRKGDDAYLRLTRFFGTLLVINIAIGVVTGLVQEFQFGMDWSAYSRFVGDVFGAPLAIEGLAAFFLESTFLGLWIFGWGRLSKRVHLATIWVVAVGASLSAAFIMAANSWMQHPVGYELNDQTGRAQLTDIWAVFTNPVFLWGYAHVISASLVTGATVMLAVSAWHLRRRSDALVFRRTASLALVVLAPTIVLAMLIGSHLGVIETTYQPMKIAAAEAQWDTCQPCSFSLFQIGGWSADDSPTKLIEVPHLLSILATGTWNGEVEGLTPLNAQYQQDYGSGSYVPNVRMQYLAMRTMAYIATLILLLAAWGLWLVRRNTIGNAKWFLRFAVWSAILPFLMNTAGWVLTESGRQPWIVQGLLETEDGVSPSVSTTTVAISLSVFILLYGVLAVVDGVLMVRYSRRQLAAAQPSAQADVRVPAMTY